VAIYTKAVIAKPPEGGCGDCFASLAMTQKYTVTQISNRLNIWNTIQALIFLAFADNQVILGSFRLKTIRLEGLVT
jgi:hypothetical protein